MIRLLTAYAVGNLSADVASWFFYTTPTSYLVLDVGMLGLALALLVFETRT